MMAGHCPDTGVAGGHEWDGPARPCSVRPPGWSELVDRFTPLVQSIIVRYDLRGQDAEDVSQTVWLHLLENLGKVRDMQALPRWISVTSRNECVNVIRKSRRLTFVGTWNDEVPADDGYIIDWDDDLVDEFVEAERRSALMKSVAALSEVHRNLLSALSEDPTPSYMEISRRLQMPVGSIGPTRARALDQLRRSYPLAAMLAATGPRGDGG
jgi:RNA polymerase sigma factor (sigma-70 family)